MKVDDNTRRKFQGRAGLYVRQPTSYRAFVPRPLPPDPPLVFDSELIRLLSQADRALGRLDAATEFLPNPDLFVAMYVRKEAVLSAQIEGTQASLVDVLENEAQARQGRGAPVAEVFNYIRAVNQGLQRLHDLPLSVRLIKEIHATLLENVRGHEREPGEFRRSQNWIGPGGAGLMDATFVPPPPHMVADSMGELENFLHQEDDLPLLVRAALAHVQLETIHPFLDGNGRMGRLLITFYLCWKGVLRRPMLYLSHYLKQRRSEYYDRLQAVRDDGDFEGWLKFFLEGVKIVSDEGVATARAVQEMREQHRALLAREFDSGTALRLHEFMFQQPMFKVSDAADAIGRTYPVANTLVAGLERQGLLKEVTGQSRNRVFQYEPYVALFGELKP